MKALGYLIVGYKYDHPPYHVHIFQGQKLIGKYELQNGRFMVLKDDKHRGRVLAALRQLGLIAERAGSK